MTGTDTGIGKTIVTAGLAAALARRGCDVGVMKPFATGARRVRGRLVSDDAEFLRRASGGRDPLELINPICLRPPLAPSMAARISGVRIDLRKAHAAFMILKASRSPLLVEGVGGLLVPLLTRLTVAHLARTWKLPVVIVARPGLGTLNHTGLTVFAARSFGLRVLGVVINHAAPSRKGLAERLNPAALEEETGVPVLGEVPFLGSRPDAGLGHRAFDRIAERLFL